MLVPMGEPLRRLCVETLKCNTQRAGLLENFGFLEDGYNSIPITLLRTTLHPLISWVSKSSGETDSGYY